MRRICLGVFLITMATLAIELLLTRVFDVVLNYNMSYFIVTSAVFAIGLAGIYVSLRPLDASRNIRPLLTGLSVACAIAVLLLNPVINALPFDPEQIFHAPLEQTAYFVGIYLALITPFFISGYILIAVFSSYTSKIQMLYFWDLTGAGIGCALIIPFIPMIGPGGLIVCSAGVMLLAAALFSNSAKFSAACVAVGVGVMAVPFLRMPHYIDFENYQEHRGILADKAAGRLEITRWDPISKIEVLDKVWTPDDVAKTGGWWTGGDRKHIAYDGGMQSSFYYKFDGDLAKLRKAIEQDRMVAREQFWQISVLAADYLKRDTGHTVLVIGSAGGQETKAALMYGASHVDAVELVAAVVDLGKTRYAQYSGNIFNRPQVHSVAGEGRSFLRASHDRYDVIQIYSNHNSSSIASGNGALGPYYLQTAEGYRQYFEHLTDDGILQVNHHVFPRMITTAALAWKQMGRTDFRKHVLVFETPAEDNLPTLLIRMTPWTQEQIAELQALLSPPGLAPHYAYTLVENPLDPEHSFLSNDFYSGDFPDSVARRVPINVTPRTDDNPYFGVLRKHIGMLSPDPKNFLDAATMAILNKAIRKKYIPMDLIHLVAITIVSLFFMCLFIIVPLRFSAVGRQEQSKAAPVLAYFACLGCGFIMIELVLIQKFMQLIGSPLYTYSTVIFVMLMASGLGSLMSERVAPAGTTRWRLPFAAIIVTVIVFTLLQAWAFDAALALPLLGRELAAAAMIFPIGFFLGMPFPLGILAISRRPPGAVAWAWGMNGAFTVIGGVVSVFLSVAFGFTVSLFVATGIYLLAAFAYRSLSPARAGVAASS
jgi:hypothetical protein